MSDDFPAGSWTFPPSAKQVAYLRKLSLTKPIPEVELDAIEAVLRGGGSKALASALIDKLVGLPNLRKKEPVPRSQAT